jgi:hypothetical protein
VTQSRGKWKVMQCSLSKHFQILAGPALNGSLFHADFWSTSICDSAKPMQFSKSALNMKVRLLTPNLPNKCNNK